MSDTHCADCGAVFVAEGCATGYGTDKNGARHCFACCGKNDRATVEKAERGAFRGVAFYVVPAKKAEVAGDGYDRSGVRVTNWPGTLSVPAAVGAWARGGFGSRRRSVYFTISGRQFVAAQYDGPCAGDLLSRVRVRA